jgi:hypothetical protein
MVSTRSVWVDGRGSLKRAKPLRGGDRGESEPRPTGMRELPRWCAKHPVLVARERRSRSRMLPKGCSWTYLKRPACLYRSPVRQLIPQRRERVGWHWQGWLSLPEARSMTVVSATGLIAIDLRLDRKRDQAGRKAGTRGIRRRRKEAFLEHHPADAKQGYPRNPDWPDGAYRAKGRSWIRPDSFRDADASRFHAERPATEKETGVLPASGRQRQQARGFR